MYGTRRCMYVVGEQSRGVVKHKQGGATSQRIKQLESSQKERKCTVYKQLTNNKQSQDRSEQASEPEKKVETQNPVRREKGKKRGKIISWNKRPVACVHV